MEELMDQHIFAGSEPVELPASISQSIMEGDVGGLVFIFIVACIAIGSEHYQIDEKSTGSRMRGTFVRFLCRLALSLLSFYCGVFAFLSFFSSYENATRFSMFARVFTYNHPEYITPFYFLLIVLCYLNLSSLKYISPCLLESFCLSMVYPLLYGAVTIFFDANSPNWYVSSFMSIPETTRLFALFTVTLSSFLIDYGICTFLKHRERSESGGPASVKGQQHYRSRSPSISEHTAWL